VVNTGRLINVLAIERIGITAHHFKWIIDNG